VKCKNCGAEIEKGAKFCKVCGAKVDDIIDVEADEKNPEKHCPNCGKEVKSDRSFCLNCGYDLKNGKPNKRREKKKKKLSNSIDVFYAISFTIFGFLGFVFPFLTWRGSAINLISLFIMLIGGELSLTRLWTDSLGLAFLICFMISSILLLVKSIVSIFLNRKMTIKDPAFIVYFVLLYSSVVFGSFNGYAPGTIQGLMFVFIVATIIIQEIHDESSVGGKIFRYFALLPIFIAFYGIVNANFLENYPGIYPYIKHSYRSIIPYVVSYLLSLTLVIKTVFYRKNILGSILGLLLVGSLVVLTTFNNIEVPHVYPPLTDYVGSLVLTFLGSIFLLTEEYIKKKKRDDA
jgi:predicted nucleic acid-binding Zn ribbon protein